MNTTLLNEITIRKGVMDDDHDKPYIFSTWLKWYKGHSSFARDIRNGIFYREHHRILDSICARESTRVLCAVFSNEPQVILGYLVYEIIESNPVIHFAFTKKEFEKEGIFRRLLEKSEMDFLGPIQFTHRTYEAETLMDRNPKADYNPYLV